MLTPLRPWLLAAAVGAVSMSTASGQDDRRLIVELGTDSSPAGQLHARRARLINALINDILRATDQLSQHLSGRLSVLGEQPLPHLDFNLPSGASLNTVPIEGLDPHWWRTGPIGPLVMPENRHDDSSDGLDEEDHSGY